jgi:glyoxylase-like metal-dependent hydrolase (beta-lactamase superfamily II)
MIFRQLFEPESSTYTYLLADEQSRAAILVDTVASMHDRDMEQLSSLGLNLLWIVETHVHADHVTGAALLRKKTGAKIAVARAGGARHVDRELADGDRIEAGSVVLRALATPGHTNGCTSYLVEGQGMVLTGDALLIRGCGRTDFQQGDARVLFHNVREKLLSLPSGTRLYPGHDYKGRTVTTVDEERRLNARLKDGIAEDQFVTIMANLKLAKPKMIDVAVPANLVCGEGYVEQQRPGAWAMRPGEGEGGDGI